MAVRRILVQRNQQIQVTVDGAHWIRSDADGKEGVAAADDGLIRVVCVQMESTAREDLGKDVARRGHALTRGASDTDAEGLPHERLSPPALHFESTPAGKKRTNWILMVADERWQVGKSAVSPFCEALESTGALLLHWFLEDASSAPARNFVPAQRHGARQMSRIMSSP